MWRGARTIATVLAVVLLGLAAWVSESWALRAARANADAEAGQLARSNAALFDSELQKFRLLPVVLAEYPDVASALQVRSTGAGPLNRRLEVLATRTGAAAIYVIAPGGTTVAASNFRLSTSFVGQNYAFRPYFTEAMARGSSELFALGTVSGRPGLYIARRVGPPSSPLGVIVVKIEFDRLEAAWRAQPGTTFVADRHGVVIISSRSGWRFARLRPLRPDEQTEIRRTRQFDALPLKPLPVAFAGSAAQFSGEPFRTTSLAVALEGARLTTLVPLEPSLRDERARVRLVVLVIAMIVAGVAIWLVRNAERLALQRAAQRDLESKVLERTTALREANAQLVREATKRQRTEERYRRSREELAQANRLATLGQVAAGVAHEINQPVAAIRTFSENAAAFIGRGQPNKAAANLHHVIDLTERIAQITGELRTFARRKTGAIGPVALDQAIEGALLLVHHRVVASRTEVAWDPLAADISVAADRVRLEQAFVNLMQNALDAMAEREGARLDIHVAQCEGQVAVSFADNGGGVPAEVRRKLFTPFATGREEGLGLGLAIARDILREFGGDLELTSTGRKGSVFTARLASA